MIRENKPKHLTFRVTKNEHFKLRNATDKIGISKSQLIRVALNEYYRKNKIVAEITTNI